MKQNVYKLRAECLQDVGNFLRRVSNQLINYSIINIPGHCYLPDVEFIFHTELALDEIIITLKGIDDGHVMVETVERLSEYTGYRIPR